MLYSSTEGQNWLNLLWPDKSFKISENWDNITDLSHISSAESQKGVNAVHWYFVENQKGINAIDFAQR